jgi:hypothetical protein
VQYFVLLLGDSHGVYVAIALTLCLKRDKSRLWNKEGYMKRPQYTRDNLTRDLGMSEPNDYFFFRLHSPLLDTPREIVTPMVTKRNTNMQEAVIPS